MPIDQLAFSYLATLQSGEIQGGTSFRKAMAQSRLDYSWESLTRVDRLIDEIRTRFRPEPDRFIENVANTNFLYLLGFYVGTVLSKHANADIHWYEYQEMVSLMPHVKDRFPFCFASSITCILSKIEHGEGRRALFVPLSSIQERLFEDPPGKSVEFSTRLSLF